MANDAAEIDELHAMGDIPPTGDSFTAHAAWEADNFICGLANELRRRFDRDFKAFNWHREIGEALAAAGFDWKRVGSSPPEPQAKCDWWTSSTSGEAVLAVVQTKLKELIDHIGDEAPWAAEQRARHRIDGGQPQAAAKESVPLPGDARDRVALSSCPL